MAVDPGNSLQICAMRVTLLDSTGAPVGGADTGYATPKISEVGFSASIREGAEIDLDGGCDCLEATFKGRNILRRFAFALNRTALEPALTALMIGATPIEDGADTIGLAWPDNELGCGDSEVKVAFEFWTKNWVDDEQDDVWPWLHHVYPTTVWQIGDTAYNATAFAPNVLNGFSRTNRQWGQGPYGDGPGYDIRRGGWFLTDVDPPTEDGYLNVTPGS